MIPLDDLTRDLTNEVNSDLENYLYCTSCKMIHSVKKPVNCAGDIKRWIPLEISYSRVALHYIKEYEKEDR